MTMEKINILVSNDDSIDAAGIQELVNALSSVANVYVSAPDTQRSASGHGITVTAPIIVTEIELNNAVRAWKISGTPADCVKLGLDQLIPKDVKIDMVFSGTNHGANLGTDVHYSGTVSAAMEALVANIPAVAMSLDNHSPSADDFKICGETAIKVLKAAYGKIDKNTVLNVNVPGIDPNDIKGMKITKLGVREYDEDFSQRENPHGQKYYWYSGRPVSYNGISDEFDVMANQDGYITITPLQFDMTNHGLREELKTWF